MNTQNEPEKKRLTINDPIEAEIRARFTSLHETRLQIANRNLDLELEKIRLMRAATSVDTERQKLFENVLIERGLPPNFPVEIDASTGIIKAIDPEALKNLEAQKAQQEAAAPPVIETQQ